MLISVDLSERKDEEILDNFLPCSEKIIICQKRPDNKNIEE